MKTIKKSTTIIIMFLVLLMNIHHVHSEDTLESLEMKNFEAMGPFEILQNINERPIFCLDTNGFSFQFGYNSVLNNIYGYYNSNINNIEDSLLLVYVKSIKRINYEINVNKLPENIKNCLIYHFFDLMDIGKCKIIHNQNKSIISRIVRLGYLKTNIHQKDDSGRSVTLTDQNKIYRGILEIEDRK